MAGPGGDLASLGFIVADQEQEGRLKASEGGSLVVFGGVQTIRSLIAADLVDEYWLKISPVVVGEGSSMFAELPDHRSLTLRAAKGYPSGLLDVTYAKQRA